MIYLNHKWHYKVQFFNSVLQNSIHYLIFRNSCFTSRSIANLLIGVDDKIARVIKASGATQAIALDISKVFHRVWHTDLPYKFRLCDIKLCEKLKVLSTERKLLKQPFDVLNYWLCGSFSYRENWNSNGAL